MKPEFNKDPKGKGGNLKTERNPWGGQAKDAHYPEFAPDSDLASAVNTLLTAECAIIIGTTRDRGALCLTILDGDDRHRTYCSDQRELHDALQMIMQTFS